MSDGFVSVNMSDQWHTCYLRDDDDHCFFRFRYNYKTDAVLVQRTKGRRMGLGDMVCTALYLWIGYLV